MVAIISHAVFRPGASGALSPFLHDSRPKDATGQTPWRNADPIVKRPSRCPSLFLHAAVEWERQKILDKNALTEDKFYYHLATRVDSHVLWRDLHLKIASRLV